MKWPLALRQALASAVMGMDANDSTASASAMIFMRYLQELILLELLPLCRLDKSKCIVAFGQQSGHPLLLISPSRAAMHSAVGKRR